ANMALRPDYSDVDIKLTPSYLSSMHASRTLRGRKRAISDPARLPVYGGWPVNRGWIKTKGPFMVSIGALARKVFGSANDRRIRTYSGTVAAISDLESEMKALSDDQLRDKTGEFRQKLADGTPIEDLLVPAF